MNTLLFLFHLILGALFTLSCFGNKQQLFRLIDKNLGCLANTSLGTFPAPTVTACATVCQLNNECGMFAIFRGSGKNGTKSKKSNLTCDLCKSTNMSSIVEKEGWSIYMEWLKEAQFHVLDTDNRSLQTNLPPDVPWNIDCNSVEVTDKRNGIMVGIWDDRNNFRDLDKVKCLLWDQNDLFSDKPPRLLHIHLEDYRQCPKNYVLTAITASNAAFRNVDKGKCSPLASQYSIDYERCVTVTTEGQQGGYDDKWRPWKAQCPVSGPHVAVSLHRRRRIHTGLKCCVLEGVIKHFKYKFD